MELMHFALDNWYGFTRKVASTVDVPYSPSFPEITFMCQHCDLLMLFRDEKINLPTSPPLPSVHPVKYHMPPDKIEHKASSEDIKATLAAIAAAVNGNINV
jgi:hypothetical protein